MQALHVRYLPTYRYRFFGAFPKVRLTLNPSSGAWHGCEIGLIWLTEATGSGELIQAPKCPAAITFRERGQVLLETPTKASHDAECDTLIRLAYNNETTASYISPVTYDLACSVLESVLAQAPERCVGLGPASPTTLAPLGQFSNLTAVGGGSEIGY